MQVQSEVLALKYRPRRFEDLIGQETVAQTLSLALETNRLSHAYLLSGLRGSGKTSTARIFAKSLLCENGPTSHPCENCTHCISANRGSHIDIIEMDAASSRKIDDIRDLIEQTKYKPSLGAFKIFIIDEVHMLTKEAFNALLKTLEEPPKFVKFILATTDPLKLPATILSRTQHFRFKKISTSSVSSHLAHILDLEKITYESEALEILARSGSGSLRDTLTLLDQAIIYSKNHVDTATVTQMLGLVDPQFFEDLTQKILNKDITALVESLKELEEYEPQMVVDEFTSWLKESLYSGDARFSILMLERFFKILSEAKSLFHINADGSFVLGLLLFKMVEAQKVKEIDTMIEALEAQVNKPDSPPQSSTQQHLPTENLADNIPLPTKQPLNRSEQMFEELCLKIDDRDMTLAECFREHVSFVSYEDGTLVWESCANEECKKKLREGFAIIRQFVREVFGESTAIKHNPCSKAQDEEPEERAAYMQPDNTTVDSNNTTTQSTPDQQNGDDILSEPMVQKTVELFGATKITVQSKV